jgi:hypothetical protein
MCRGYVRLTPYPDLTVEGGKAGLISGSILDCLSQAANLIKESKFAYGVTDLSIYTQSLLGRVHFPKWLFGRRS